MHEPLAAHLTQDQADEYAIGALEDDVDRAVSLHLLECEPCRSLAVQAQALAASFALSAPLEPPPRDLRRRVFESTGIARPSLLGRFARYGAAAVLVASIAIAAAAFTGMVSLRGQVEDLRDANHDLDVRVREAVSTRVEIAALDAKLDDAERITAQLTEESQKDKELLLALMSDASKSIGVVSVDDSSPAIGRLVWDPDSNILWFVASGLPQLPVGEIYKIWLNSAGSYINIGAFNSDESGYVRYQAPLGQDLRTYDGAVITIESLSSSIDREGPPVFVMNLATLQ